MGAVEVVYELKDKTDYIVASSMEIIYKGFPYDKVIPELIKPAINYKSVAKHYFDYYDNMQEHIVRQPFLLLKHDIYRNWLFV